MARLLSVQSREEFGISRLRRQLFKEYTISCVLKSHLILDDCRLGSQAAVEASMDRLPVCLYQPTRLRRWDSAAVGLHRLRRYNVKR
jgi:hypothetical protein